MADEKKPKRPTPMTNVSKPDQALDLLKRAHDLLSGIGGKKADIWQGIAANVQSDIEHVEKYK